MRTASQQKLIIAIDGPAGAGKSTIASALSKKLGYTNLESGAMYRALGLKALESGVSLDDESALFTLASASKIDLEPTPDGNRVLLDGKEITARIRLQDVAEAASRVSVHPKVRHWMVNRQREMGALGGIVMEGRDIGTAVFPNAEVKIFLDANPEVRALRRLAQNSEKPGPQKSAAEVAAELRQRDERDRNRAVSPLEPAADAVILDSSSMSIEEVVERAMDLVRSKLGAMQTSK